MFQPEAEVIEFQSQSTFEDPEPFLAPPEIPMSMSLVVRAPLVSPTPVNVSASVARETERQKTAEAMIETTVRKGVSPWPTQS